MTRNGHLLGAPEHPLCRVVVVSLEVGERRVDVTCHLHDVDEATRNEPAVDTDDLRRYLVVVGGIEVAEKDQDDDPRLVTW